MDIAKTNKQKIKNKLINNEYLTVDEIKLMNYLFKEAYHDSTGSFVTSIFEISDDLYYRIIWINTDDANMQFNYQACRVIKEGNLFKMCNIN